MLLSRAVAAQPQPGASISGVITNRSTGEPLHNALVTVLDSKDGFGTTLTDSKGRYIFSDLPVGDYRVRATREGFEPFVYGAKESNRPGTFISPSAGEVRSDISISLEPLGVITGVVLDEEGDPLPFAAVRLSRVPRRGDLQNDTIEGAETNQRGEYRFFDVPAGRYYVSATYTNCSSFHSRPNVTADPPAPSAPLPFSPQQAPSCSQFFPAANQLAAAEVLNLTPGKELHGIDFRLRTPQLIKGKLHGKLVVPDSIKEGLWQVEVGGAFMQGYEGQLPNDTFEDMDLAPGKYVLIAMLNVGAKHYRGVQSVDITSGGDAHVTIPLEAPVDIPGTIQILGPGAENYRNFQVKFWLKEGLASSLFLPLPPTAIVKGDLQFLLSNVMAGTWFIDVSPIPPGGYVKAIFLGDEDVLTEEMVIGPKSTGPLKIVLSTQAAKLEGDLDELKDGTRAIVVLAPAGKYSHVASFYGNTVTDAKGHFKMEGLTPGEYNMYAFENVDPRDYLNPDALKPFAKRAVTVVLHEGQTASAKPELIPAAETSEKTK